MLRIVSVTALLLIFTFSNSSAGEARLLRFPDVSKDKIAFVYAGDIYVVSRDGGQAVRLTSHEGLELFPKFSPDGTQIAFTGQYDGDYAVYVVPVTGGEPQRLTYHPGILHTSERFGPENIVLGWHPDGKRVVYRSRKEANDWWEGRIYLASLDGGLPEVLPMKVAGFTSLSPDAKKVAYCPIYRDFRTWKRYKGGMAQDVWTFDLETYEAEKITDWEGTDNMPMWYGDKIYFNSDRTGKLNLYVYDLATGQTRAVTNFSEYDVRWPSLGPDGIAFENGGYVYVLDLPSETLRKITVELSYDGAAMRTEFANVSDKISEYDISPDGKRAVFRARGELFTVPVREGNTRNLTNTSGANEKYPTWSPDGKWIACISDIDGEDELYLISSDGKQKIRMTEDGCWLRYRPVWSPDSKKIAYSDKELNLYYIDIEAKKPVKVDKATRNEIHDYVWSPDSRFVAYTKVLDNEIRAIFIYGLEDASVHQVTPGFTEDYSPVFDPEGKYLYFLSRRDFNPILSAYEFEFVNQFIDNLFLIVLSADEISPFAPKSDEVEIKSDVKEVKKDDKSKREEATKTPPVKIDFDGIYDRQVAFDLPAGSYGNLSALPGAVFYMSYPMHGLTGKVTPDEPTLYKYNLKEKKNHKFFEGLNGYRLATGAEQMLLSKDNQFYIVKTGTDTLMLTDKPLDISHMEMQLDRRAEMVQMFNQVWRIERDLFYDENLHGVDWPAVRRRYEVMLPYVAHRFDLTYLLGEMVGELCCSHTYIGGGDSPDIPSGKVGLLGAEFEIDRSVNLIRISRILKGEYWDEELRSPLREPGLEVSEGDYLLAIDGQKVTGDIDPYSLTRHCADRTVVLTVNANPSFDGARDITVRPIASEEKLRYYNWVEERRKYVDSVSGGKIGYIHLPDMDSFGLVRFTKMFYHQLRKPGIIIDVRYNGGGFVSGLILERLRRTVEAMGKSRAHVSESGGGIYAHMITLINQFSCSDGDYFPYFFRQYQLGPLLGMRTWGGVVGISGYRPLVDGGYFTVPQGGIYNMEGDWVMENVGVAPDMEVDNPPDRMTRGYDDQLMQAVDYIMKKLEEDPKELPKLNGPPTPR
ncbi:MAG: S41 family peptidase [Candidatus Zixiibacteriota bacterium]